MPFRCWSTACAWDDEDVSGHTQAEMPAFQIAHPDDPNGGHLVRIRFDDPNEDQRFIERLERERPVVAR